MKLTTTLFLILFITVIYSQDAQQDLLARTKTLGVKVTRTLPVVEEKQEEITYDAENEEEEVSEETSQTEELSNETVTAGEAIVEETDVELSEEISEEVSTKSIEDESLSTNEVTSGKIITVQIAASKRLLPQSFFGYTPEFHFKNKDGFYRYYSVTFPTVKAAQDYAENLRKGTKFKEAHVVELENGVKTVTYFGQYY